MKKSKRIQDNLLMFLVAAIVILCVGFIVIGCGSDPMLKVVDPNKGQYAIDFSECTADSCYGLFVSEAFVSEASKVMEDSELSVEAWVKKDSATAASDFTGGIFGRFDSSGIQLYVKNGVPKAAIRKTVGTGTATSTADYIVDSGITPASLWDAAWHHLAAVLTNNAHTHSESASCTLAVMAQTPHLDIYVDGAFTECATTASSFSGLPFEGYPVMYVGFIPGSLSKLDNLAGDTLFPGAIDEARLWGTARTATEISTCMSQELGFNSGTCGRDTDDLISYVRFNEGIGSSINDWAGLGGGILEDGGHHFEGGWVAGVPSSQLTRADD